jgi:hypothetical protein
MPPIDMGVSLVEAARDLRTAHNAKQSACHDAPTGRARKTALAKDDQRHSCDKSGRNFRVRETSAGTKRVSVPLRKIHHRHSAVFGAADTGRLAIRAELGHGLAGGRDVFEKI